MASHWTLHVATTNLCVMSFRGWAFPCPVLLQVSPYSFPVLSRLMTLTHLFPALPKPWHLPGSASAVDVSIVQLGIEQCSLLLISQLLLPFRFLLPFFSSYVLPSLTYLPHFPFSSHFYFYQHWFLRVSVTDLTPLIMNLQIGGASSAKVLANVSSSISLHSCSLNGRYKLSDYSLLWPE